jgi:hypothetical protein
VFKAIRTRRTPNSSLKGIFLPHHLNFTVQCQFPRTHHPLNFILHTNYPLRDPFVILYDYPPTPSSLSILSPPAHPYHGASAPSRGSLAHRSIPRLAGCPGATSPPPATSPSRVEAGVVAAVPLPPPLVRAQRETAGTGAVAPWRGGEAQEAAAGVVEDGGGRGGAGNAEERRRDGGRRGEEARGRGGPSSAPSARPGPPPPVTTSGLRPSQPATSYGSSKDGRLEQGDADPRARRHPFSLTSTARALWRTHRGSGRRRGEQAHFDAARPSMASSGGGAAWAQGRGGSSSAPSGGLTSTSTTGPGCSELRIGGRSGTPASKLGALSCGGSSSSLQRAPSAGGRCGVVGREGVAASIRGARWE